MAGGVSGFFSTLRFFRPSFTGAGTSSETSNVSSVTDSESDSESDEELSLPGVGSDVSALRFFAFSRSSMLLFSSSNLM